MGPGLKREINDHDCDGQRREKEQARPAASGWVTGCAAIELLRKRQESEISDAKTLREGLADSLPARSESRLGCRYSSSSKV